MGRAKIIPAKNTLFLPYQERWIRDRSRLKLMEKSRQIGLSWGGAYDMVREESRAGARLDAWISSRDEIQARLFLVDCLKFAEILNIAAEDLGEQVIDAEKNTAFVLRLASGVKINSMSSSPDAQAGKRGSRLLDEFALHKDPRKLYTIAYPGITWGGQLGIISTHRGSANFFNELVREIKEKGNPKKISPHTVTLENALDQGFLFKLQSKLPPGDERQDMDEADYFNFIRSGCADEESFLQEYMCIPADDNSAFLTYDMIAACEYRENENWEIPLPEIKNPLFVGVDIGREHDLTVIWVNEYAGGRHLARKIIELKSMPFSEQEKILYPILELPNMRRCCIDASGLGMQFAERAGEKYGKYRIESVKFSAPVKESLAYPLRAQFEDLNIRLPFDKYIRADLRSIKKETTPAGNIRFTADRGKNGHADRFWAAALAAHAASGGSGIADAVEIPGSSRYADNWLQR
ncbi:MAG: terminase family protein [Kiritimatiellae bacterium]|nr:terminase family protein [Kiritimatiellia bacterium]